MDPLPATGTVVPGTLEDRTIIISGGSRGIGLAILIAAGRRGANAVILAKTDAPDPRLPGTVHTAVQAIRDAGGQAVPVVGDVRREEDVQRAVDTAIETFGGIDICINNASVLNKSGTADLDMRRFDLMQQVNVRGTFCLTKAALPALRRSDRARILTLSPPLNLDPRWLGQFPAYTAAKYGMTLLTLGWAAEFAADGIDANCLWPQTRIATTVVQNLLGGQEAMATSREPRIVADAAMLLLEQQQGATTGQTVIDADVLAHAGIHDLSGYGGGANPTMDLYIDDE